MKAAARDVAKIERDATVMLDVQTIAVTFRSVPPQEVRDALKRRGFRFGSGRWTYRPREFDEASRAWLRGDADAAEREAAAVAAAKALAREVAHEVAAAGLRVVLLGDVDGNEIEYEIL